jgi:hypothetical protein
VPAKLREAKERRPTFSPELLSLFAELENAATPPRHWRKKQEFARKSQHLASQLGLSDAWWMGLKVEKHEQQRPREGLAAHEWWPRVRAVRKQLLEAIAAREIQPTDEEARPAP